jgi:hypothetical protein
MVLIVMSRSATVKELGKVTNLLLSWEKEIHSMNKVDTGIFNQNAAPDLDPVLILDFLDMDLED